MNVAMVIVVLVMSIRGTVAASSSSQSNRPELQRLRERIDSHTETLRNINWYLKQTDVFWVWFQENRGRLDEILSADRTAPLPDNNILLRRLDDLEQKDKAREKQIQQMQDTLQAERRKTNRLENRVREIPRLREKMLDLEAQLRTVNQTTRENQRDIAGVIIDVHEVKQQMEMINKSQSSVTVELHALNERLEGIAVNIVFPLESKVQQLNQSQHTLNDETKQNYTDLKRQINSISSKGLSKKVTNGVLQKQITDLQTSVGSIQGNISKLDGRISSFQNKYNQRDNLQQDHAVFRNRISELERSSEDMNQNLKKTIVNVNELQREVTDLKQRIRSSSYDSSISSPAGVPTVTPPPFGPPGRHFEGTLGRPGNQGRRGIPGDPGTPGTPGAPGSRGERGSPGAPGDRGSRGSPGRRGVPGNPGSRGMPGEQGVQGSPGSRGMPGEHGVPGSPGSRGMPGEQGVPGSPGSRGMPGEQGVPGSPGTPGARGATGNTGPRGSPGSRGAPGGQGAPGTSHSNEYRSRSRAPSYSALLAGPGYSSSQDFPNYRSNTGFAPSYGRSASAARYGGF